MGDRSAQLYVYFIKPIGFDGPIKIGCSHMPIQRLLSIATWSPFPLEIIHQMPGGVRLEGNLHECFFDLHSHREWFHAKPRLLDFLRKLKAGVPVEQAIDLTDRRGSIRMAAIKRRFTPEMLLRLRLSSAVARIENRKQIVSPDDVRAIINRWRQMSEDRCLVLDDADVAVLQAYVADPYLRGTPKSPVPA